MIIYIGIDIEKINHIDLDIAHSYFSKTEYEMLMKKSSEKQMEFFYDIWTLKESYVKFIGKGLSISLDSFYFELNKQNIILYSDNIIQKVYCKLYNIYSGYKMALCSKENIKYENVSYIDLEKIIIN